MNSFDRAREAWLHADNPIDVETCEECAEPLDDCDCGANGEPDFEAMLDAKLGRNGYE